ncbi:MAG: SDR family NAD(P)-dependent oxidoreductase [Nitrososphaeraceae archaeon]
MGSNDRYQSKRCLSFYKGCSSLHDRTAGVIVNVNSGAGKTGFSNLSSYCASKFGLAGLAESLALEVKSYNIRVTTIFLGQVATRMWRDYDYNYYEKNKNKMLSPQKVAAKIVEMILDIKITKMETL